ncbi:hypothetical protein Skr01_36350 [Sphaerisporangium krabiense]|uniref:Uncharacterized protein n=1 Tax=Sphaerisporangium krabiense TaxID=763782 RepID=A0A7W8Z376_9ACTN|nr:hypothetical protein [Sphaerisporangium krabiense]MBB5626628.1 hypothetical protein [Sphaerisporangium krabiense]GII63550.1 hypothetical protein Skr01_36350 [Sphaerisporangium krabiense]
MARITAPVQGYNGTIGDVVFENGVAETDNPAVIAYCRGAGYTVDGETIEAAHEPPVDSRDVERVRLGTPLRDAAVDPWPEDFLPPTNAGQADPHGPQVVSPGAHAVPPAPIVPGPVSPDPDEQQAAETEVAQRVLVEGQPATVVAERSRPPQSAPKAAWVDYAVSQGADRGEAEATSKADLIDRYGRDQADEEK